MVLSHQRSQSGVTFVETLVGMAIGIIVITGIALISSALSRNLGNVSGGLRNMREIGAAERTFREYARRIHPPYWARTNVVDEAPDEIGLSYFDRDAEKDLTISVTENAGVVQIEYASESEKASSSFRGTEPVIAVIRDASGTPRGLSIRFNGFDNELEVIEYFSSQIVSLGSP